MAETLTAPIEDKIEFVTAEQADKVSKMMTKDWVKSDATGKPLKSKDFIYRIISCHPYEKAGHLPPMGHFLISLEVQKFYRIKFATKKVMVGGETKDFKENQKVDSHRFTGITDDKFNPGGSWECVDEDANRQIDLGQFLKEYAVDAQD